MRYNPAQIEKKWQAKWLRESTYEPDLRRAQKPYYNLMMFPYPSAEGLHIGSVRTFTGVDIYGRMKRMQGYDVFEPIGLDGFGIHSENYALKIKKHPAKLAKVTEKNFYRQLGIIGNGFAWREKLETYDPDYYKWTQWIFVQMFKRGLAYRKKAKVNWCPSCLTVLADEQVLVGECERCGTTVVKKELEQWFFKITDYAERLLKNLETIDWDEKVKIAQRNWIGKSEGAEIEFRIKNSELRIKVFTTRPDTLFGATYMVLAPEHQLLINNKLQITNYKEVEDYKKSAAKKSEMERTAETKEKTGVELKGIRAINPANKEEIPIWISDYVLATYGTGAIMAVPAHDARDFEFAKKFSLPVVQVVLKIGAPVRSYLMGADKITDDELTKLGIKIIKRTKDGDRKIEIPEASIKDYESLINRKLTPGFWNEYIGQEAVFIFKHKNDKLERIVLDKATESRIDKLAAEFVGENWDKSGVWKWLAENDWYTDTIIHTEDGKLINSEKFSGVDSETAKKEITKFVGGTPRVQYRLRDWLISRQRYWGPPIPMIYCNACGWQPVPEKDLPVRLPFVKNFRPTGTGKSPLASVKSFYEVKCPKCRKKARRETDVSDTFLDSAWYFLRYPSVRESRNPWDQAATKKWLPVDMYIGGAEHAVLHLLYSRFLTMVFHNWGLLDFDEPFERFRTHGLIIREGAKMSKSKGNVVDPDPYIKAYGADAVRMYLAFIAPLTEGGDFRDTGISGITRFLARIWKFYGAKPLAASSLAVRRAVHKTIKKVTEDIEALRYNTAIAALMILLNAFEAEPQGVGLPERKIFLQLLAPFAPHLAEELWANLKQKFSIHHAKWPAYDAKSIHEEHFTLIVQVNGSLRDRVSLPRGATQAEAETAARNSAAAKYLAAGSPKKIIFVPDRLINFVF